MRYFLVLILTFQLCSICHAKVKPNNIFSDNMVLQRDTNVPVWGNAAEGEKVIVEFAGQKLTTTATNGKWIIWLQPLHTNSAPKQMTIKGENTIKINNILIGEVWLCSGQSNMEMPVGKSGVYKGVENFEQEVKDVNYPQIRFLQVPHSSSGLAVLELNVRWTTCSSESVYWSSAVSFFFAKKLSHDLQVPVGIINAAWGGSAIQPWTPVVGFEESNGFEKEITQIQTSNKEYNISLHLTKKEWETQINAVMDTLAPVKPSVAWLARPTLPESGHKLTYPGPSSLFNAMIAPLIPYGIHGVLWYQGESNLGDGAFYTKRMEALIKGWRKEWRQGDFPFYFVQIAPFVYKDWPVKNATPDLLPTLWDAQRAVLSISNTGMVSTEDIGDPEDIHPRRKQQVGERLADLAIKHM